MGIKNIQKNIEDRKLQKYGVKILNKKILAEENHMLEELLKESRLITEETEVNHAGQNRDSIEKINNRIRRDK